MRHKPLLSFTLFLLAAALHAQTPTKAPPLDVLSVKPDTSDSHDGSISLRADGIYVQHAPFRFLLLAAFGNDFAEDHIVNMPSWAGDQFNVVGKVSDADLSKLHNLNREQYIEMRSQLLQAVLAERFQLKTHTEVRQGRVYALVPAKSGPKLKLSGDNPPAEYISPQGQHVQLGTMATTGQIAGHVAPVAMLIRSLNSAGQLDRVVIDRTGLTGNFDYALNWKPDSPAPTTDNGADDTALPSLLTAIQEQLGLRLEPATGPINTLVIDHIEKPSSN
ncbi:TIGR03435 family protein [Granulicella paludicola]|uniref:TIGR03435 family protein n=1 Tax=Granulicella paludicola TaxID=474951 RepID=UPI0021E09143|nr:TIGR03435 family protein [Granulicella paludicola]